MLKCIVYLLYLLRILGVPSPANYMRQSNKRMQDISHITLVYKIVFKIQRRLEYFLEMISFNITPGAFSLYYVKH